MKRCLIILGLVLLTAVPAWRGMDSTKGAGEGQTLAAILDLGGSNLLASSLQAGMKPSSKSQAAVQATASPVAANQPAAPPTEAYRANAPQPVSRSMNADKAQTRAAQVNYTGSSQQSEMLAYINQARKAANLAPLVLTNSLSVGAALKSQDMAVNYYFGHTSPTYGKVDDMMDELGISYRVAAENLAKNYSVDAAHDAFMNSTGHRNNILNPQFKKVGLGFYRSGEFVYVTEWFTN